MLTENRSSARDFLLPMYLFALATVPVALFALCVSGSLNVRIEGLLFAITVGFYLSGLSFLGMLSSLMFRSWVQGYLLGLLLTVLVMLTSLAASEITMYVRYDIWPDADQICGPLLCSPILLLSVVAPFLAMRKVSNWILSRNGLGDERPPLKHSAGVADLLIFTAISAAAFMCCQSFVLLFPRGAVGVVASVVAFSVCLSILTFCVAVPAVSLGFRFKNFHTAVGSLIAWSLAYTTISLLILWVLSQPGLGLLPRRGWDEFFEQFATCFASTSVLTGGIITLRLGGYRLAKLRAVSATVGEQEASPLKESWTSEELQIEKERQEIRLAAKSHGRWAAMCFALLAICPIVGALVRAARDVEAQNLNQKIVHLQSQGGELRLTDLGDKFSVLKLPPGTAVEQLFEYGEISELRELSLTGTELETLTFLIETPKLRKLDLSGSTLSDDKLRQLLSLSELEYLDVSETNITLEGVEFILRNLKLEGLGISGLNVDWHRLVDLLERKANVRLRSLKIGSPTLTSKQLAHLLERTRFRNLDLSTSSIDVSAFPQKISFDSLILDGSSITDDDLNELLRRVKTISLSLARTNVTDRGLAALTNVKFKVLDLSETNVTDEGLAECSQANWRHLKLNGTPTIGSFLDRWPQSSSLRALELADTQVGYEACAALEKLTNLEFVNFAGTNVTAKGISKLTSDYKQIRIDRCEVSASELVANSKGFAAIYIGVGQYNASQYTKLRSVFNVSHGKSLEFETD